MRNAMRAGLWHFALVYGAGFVLGLLRVLVTAPRLGNMPALLLELPVMIAFSWWACGFALRRAPVPRTLPDRIAMGTLAFALVMFAEYAAWVVGLGQPVASYVAGYRAVGAQLGLVAQLMFAAFPLIRR